MSTLSNSVLSLPNLTRGSTGAAVSTLQKALMEAGFMTQEQVDTGPGFFGPLTELAVSKWQAENQIDTQGNPGSFGPISKSFISNYTTSDDDSDSQNDLSGDGDGISDTDLKDEDDGTGVDPTDGTLPPELSNTTLAQMDDNAWNILFPPLTPGTPEYDKALEGVSIAFYDQLQRELTANTEEEKKLADYSWGELKKQIENTLNITLSDNTSQAWDTIEGLKEQYSSRGLAGSGLERESIDDSIRASIRANKRGRKTAETGKEHEDMVYYKTYATPEEMKKFAEENPELAKAWGIIPSDELKNSLSFDTLMEKYPEMSDEEINNYRLSILDENGNRRSSLYQKYLYGEKVGIDPGIVDYKNATYDGDGNIIEVPVHPGDIGMKDINKSAEDYRREMLKWEAYRKAQEAKDAAGATPVSDEDKYGGKSGGPSGKVPRLSTGSGSGWSQKDGKWMPGEWVTNPDTGINQFFTEGTHIPFELVDVPTPPATPPTPKTPETPPTSHDYTSASTAASNLGSGASGLGSGSGSLGSSGSGSSGSGSSGSGSSSSGGSAAQRAAIQAQINKGGIASLTQGQKNIWYNR